MRDIVYYVAVSIDGYIAGEEDDISGFTTTGSGLSQYLEDLKDFDTVIMGRRTYEFGYKFDLQPGQPAYPHMQHYIFSNTLHLPKVSDQVHVEPLSLDRIHHLRDGAGSDIYLCGGGIFSGWLLNHQLIDRVKIKLNPLILGKGIPMFVGVKQKYQLELLNYKMYDEGLQIIEYKIHYEN